MIKTGTHNLENRLLAQSQSVLSNAIVRLLSSTLKKSFQKWQKSTLAIHLQQKILQKLINSFTTHKLRSSFQSWHSNVYCLSHYQSSFSLHLTHQSHLLSQKSSKSSLHSTHLSSLSTSISHLLSSSHSHSLFLTHFCSHLHILSNKHSTSRLQSYFNAWREVVLQKKERIERVCKILEGKLRQKFMSGVKWVGRTREYVYNRRRLLHKIMSRSYREELREAIGKWRSIMYVKHRSIKEWTSRQREDFEGHISREMKREKKGEGMLIGIFWRNKRLREIMRKWRVYLEAKRGRERKVELYRDTVQKKRVRRAVEKWRKRRQAKNKLNVDIENFNRRRMNRMRMNVFRELYTNKVSKKTL